MGAIDEIVESRVADGGDSLEKSMGHSPGLSPNMRL
jgi:hypothetical protein